MKVKRIILSLALLSSVVGFVAYGMEKPDPENDFIGISDISEKNVDADDSNNSLEVDGSDSDSVDWTNTEEVMGWLAEDIGDVVKKNNIKEVETFLADGVDPNYVYDTSEPLHVGESILITAIREGNHQMAKLLLDAGADQYFQSNTVFEPKEGKELRSLNALDWALFLEDDVAVQVLIDYGFDINAEGSRGVPLRCAFGKCLELLLENGADVNKLNSINGLPPLFDSIVGNEGNPNAPEWLHKAKLLCDKGANINFKDKNGRTVAFYLIENACINLLKYLYERGLDLTIADQKGLTPLQYAKNKLAYYKQRFGHDVMKINRNMSLSRYGSKKSFVNKTVKKQQLKKRRQIIENLGSKEFLDDYQEIENFIKRSDIEFAKKIKLLSIGARYNESAFQAKHDFSKDAYNNTEKIAQLSNTLLKGQDGRDLSPYISVRAPQMLEFMNYVKESGSSADKESKRFKN